MADVHQVAVAAVDFFAAGGHGHSVAFGVIEAVLARLQPPLAPRRDDFQMRRQRLVSVLKAHLVVALAGAAVRHSRRSFAHRYLNLMFGDDRPRQRRPQQIFVLIHRARADGGKDIFEQKLLAHVFHHYFRCARSPRLFHHRVKIVALAHIGDHGDDLGAVIFLEPGDDDGSIQAAGISENYFLRHVRSCDRTTVRRRRAESAESPFARASGFPPDRRQPSAMNL